MRRAVGRHQFVKPRRDFAHALDEGALFVVVFHRIPPYRGILARKATSATTALLKIVEPTSKPTIHLSKSNFNSAIAVFKSVFVTSCEMVNVSIITSPCGACARARACAAFA